MCHAGWQRCWAQGTEISIEGQKDIEMQMARSDRDVDQPLPYWLDGTQCRVNGEQHSTPVRRGPYGAGLRHRPDSDHRSIILVRIAHGINGPNERACHCLGPIVGIGRDNSGDLALLQRMQSVTGENDIIAIR